MSNDKISAYIRKQLRIAREEAGLSQQDIANQLGKTRSNVSDIERGRLNINAHELAIIANYLNKPLNYFFPEDILSGISKHNYSSEDLEFAYKLSLIKNPDLKKSLIIFLDKLIDIINNGDNSL